MDSLSKEQTILPQGAYETDTYELCVSDLDMLLKSEQPYAVGDCLHEDATFCVELDHEIPHVLPFGVLPDSTQQIAMMPVNVSVSTSTLPSMENYPGPYSFDVVLNKSAGDKAKWEHSKKMNKLFAVMNANIPLKLKVNPVEPGLFVRLLPIFLEQDSFAEPVKRCPTHVSNLEMSNQDFIYVDHVVRCHHQRAIYHKDPESQRLSVIVPTEPPQPGCDWFALVCSFMCKNSCILGMKRRSTALILTLERQSGEVVGRKLLNFRICSCPRRDMIKEEKDLEIAEAANERQIMENKSSDKNISTTKYILIKKPVKRLSDGLVNIRISKKYLKPLREMILMNKPLSVEERTCLEDINKLLL